MNIPIQPIQPIHIYRCHVAAHYTTITDRISMALKVKYWWNGTDPNDIDDELGEVIDGQFFGPEWMRNIIYALVDFLDRRACNKRNRWAKRWMEDGDKPPMRWLMPIPQPSDPDLSQWENYFRMIFIEDDSDY